MVCGRDSRLKDSKLKNCKSKFKTLHPYLLIYKSSNFSDYQLLHATGKHRDIIAVGVAAFEPIQINDNIVVDRLQILLVVVS